MIRGRLGHVYKVAFERAFRELAPAERSVLRLYYVDQLGIDALGRLLGLHRATAARRIAVAREKLRAQTETHVRTEAGLTSSELGSAVRFIADQLDLSIERVFAEEPVPEASAG